MKHFTIELLTNGLYYFSFLNIQCLPNKLLELEPMSQGYHFFYSNQHCLLKVEISVINIEGANSMSWYVGTQRIILVFE